MIYLSKSNERPDEVDNDAAYRPTKIKVNGVNETVFANEYIYLGIYTLTGCSFALKCSFGRDFYFKPAWNNDEFIVNQEK